MTATIETEPTYIGNHERGIWLHNQARFRFGKYKASASTTYGRPMSNIFGGSLVRIGSSKSSKHS